MASHSIFQIDTQHICNTNNILSIQRLTSLYLQSSLICSALSSLPLSLYKNRAGRLYNFTSSDRPHRHHNHKAFDYSNSLQSTLSNMMSAFSFFESSSSSSISVVEALAFNYLSHSLVVMINNLWTLVALLTAAVSFWRFNLLPSLARRHCLLKPSSSSSVVVVVAESFHPQPLIDSRPIIDSVQSTPPSVDDDTPPFVKADRVYSRFCYRDDVFMHHEDEAEEEEEEEIRLVRQSIISRTRTVRMDEEDKTLRFDVAERRLMMWDLGFYDYQDMRVLDGNVVKLWNKSYNNNTYKSAGHIICG